MLISCDLLTLKAISPLKTKKKKKPFLRKNIFFYAFFKYIYRSWLFHSYHTYQLNSQSMGPPDERKAGRTHNLLVKKQIPWNKSIMGAMSASQNLQLLESDSVTRLVLFCSSTYPFRLWIYCGKRAR